MNVALQFLIRHGYSVVFLWVLGEQAGLPVPSIPLLLAAGNLSGVGSLNLCLILLLGVIACLRADTAWFLLGRHYGGCVLKLLCRISLEPDSCVRRTDDRIGKHGARLLLFAKFVPGLNTVAVPIAGRSGISLRNFLIFDTLGSTLWVVTFTIIGRLCGPALHRDPYSTICPPARLWRGADRLVEHRQLTSRMEDQKAPEISRRSACRENYAAGTDEDDRKPGATVHH